MPLPSCSASPKPVRLNRECLLARTLICGVLVHDRPGAAPCTAASHLSTAWLHSLSRLATGAPLHDADEARVKEVNKRLLSQKDLPEFEPVPLTLADLLAEGRRLVGEQEAVNQGRLGELYMKGVVWGEDALGGWSSSEDSGDEEPRAGRSLLG